MWFLEVLAHGRHKVPTLPAERKLSGMAFLQVDLQSQLLPGQLLLPAWPICLQ